MFGIRPLYLAPLVTAFIVAGCGTPAGPECEPVKGSITFNGKPLAEAIVVLHPADGDVAGNQKPMATTDAGGNFELTTFTRNDGAPVGDYAITIELRAVETGGEEPVRTGRNLLPPRYAKPETSGLKYMVVEGENQIPPIEIAPR
jgi:hypothetical protein